MRDIKMVEVVKVFLVLVALFYCLLASFNMTYK